MRKSLLTLISVTENYIKIMLLVTENIFLNSNDRLESAAENNVQLVNCKITKRLNTIRAW